MGPVVSARLAAKAWAYERPAKKLREDVTGTDLILLQVALAAIASTTQDSPRVADRDDIGQLYRRYLWVLLDGLRPHRDATSPLPAAASRSSIRPSMAVVNSTRLIVARREITPVRATGPSASSEARSLRRSR
jgi:hypothetical protein